MIVTARGLVRAYETPRGPIVAIRGVDLDVERGEFLAITGRSGSGKSTLLAMLAGLCRPTSGTLAVDGADLTALSPAGLADFRARKLGLMFQSGGLLPGLRAIDNVALPALLAGQADAEARARDLLARVGLGDRWDAHPGELSGGQQRRVAIARALIGRPVLLLADEPTNDLDEVAESKILGLLLDLHRDLGTTLVVVTHDRELAARADRVITLRSGRLYGEHRTTREPDAPRARPPVSDVLTPSPTHTSAGSSPFEESPGDLTPADPTPLGTGFPRFLVGFLGWVALGASVLYGVDAITARIQSRAIVARVEKRKKSEDLAMQQLRADVNDVAYRPDGSYEVSLYLQSFAPERPFYVLGPEVRAFVQVDRTWQPVVLSRPGRDDARIHEVGAGRTPILLTLRIAVDRYDELIPGYFHVRLSSTMVVSESAVPTEDLFERNDDYYIYLKPQNLTEDQIRARNRWQPGALVPRWIPMPAH